MADEAKVGAAPLTGLESVLARNIVAMEARRRAELKDATGQEKAAQRIGDFAGSMLFVYLHLAAFALWLLSSFGLFGLPKFDPTLVGLATFASVEAIFISTFVLITQNRQAKQAERRSELDLQTTLLAEHEVTKLIGLTRAIARHLQLPEADDAELDDLARDVTPETVLDAIETQEQADYAPPPPPLEDTRAASSRA